VRVVSRDGFRLTRGGEIAAADARAHIAADLAADVARVLASGATHCGMPLGAGDLAVIVAARDHGLVVQRALAERGVAAVVAGGGHVLLTPAADQWLTLLEALEQPHRSARVRAAALTSFFGRTVEDLADDDTLTDRLADTVRGWALLLRARGVAALFEAAEERDLSARVLATTEGERLLTDLRHVAQILHDVAVRERLGLTALLQWLRAERLRTVPTPERTRRLDSDAAAVQIVTVHGSKGLQYPVVYLPFAYEKYVHPNDTALFHDDDGRRCLDVSGAGPQWAEHDRRHKAEEAGEELRDLYVALTRAQSQVVAWWAPTSNTPTGGLHRLLFGRMPGTTGVPDRQVLRDDDYVAGVFTALAELGGPVWERSAVADGTTAVPARTPVRLAVRTFDRTVDVEWRRTSYSGLIRVEATVPDGVTVEPEVAGPHDEDEPPVDVGAATAQAASDAPVSPMADLPAGADLGLLVHAVLEHADPTAPDLVAELTEHAREQQRWFPADVAPEALAEALAPLHDTLLGPLVPGLTLRDVPLGDRLRELDFELPLAGGDLPRHHRPRRLRDLAPLLRRHLPDDDPLAAYAHQLEAPGLGDQRLTGYLAGSVDAVLRVPVGDDVRYVVVDWKTNRLGDRDEVLTAGHYTRPAMADSMLHAHYPLQALLYSVVVHRYLRWRLTDYDPHRHLGGVLYLFLRGMCGPVTPVIDGHPAGVFSWRPPVALVEALSDLLDGEEAAA
jgi:exodeoxyribonuclease V beta subunit